MDFSGRDSLQMEHDEGGYHYAVATPSPHNPFGITKVEDLDGIVFDKHVMPLPILSEVVGKGVNSYHRDSFGPPSEGETYLSLPQIVARLQFEFPGRVYIGDLGEWSELFGISSLRDITIPGVASMLRHIFPISPMAAVEFTELFQNDRRNGDTYNLDLLKQIFARHLYVNLNNDIKFSQFLMLAV